MSMTRCLVLFTVCIAMPCEQISWLFVIYKISFMPVIRSMSSHCLISFNQYGRLYILAPTDYKSEFLT